MTAATGRLRAGSLLAATSVLISAGVVAGIRTVQRAEASNEFASVPVTVDLPGALRPAVATVFALHRSPLHHGTDRVPARADAAGLLTATTATGDVVGAAIVERSALLRLTHARIDFGSTARALVLDSPALVTSSPMLAALIDADARRSVAVTTLAQLLQTEASARSDYLDRPDAALLQALGVAERDVSARVAADLQPTTATGYGTPAGLPSPTDSPATTIAAPPTDSPATTIAAPPTETPSATATASPTPTASPVGPTSAPAPPSITASASPTATDSSTSPALTAPSSTGDRLVLYDTSGRSSCASHAVADGLCLMNSDPPRPDAGSLYATNWTGAWQFLFAAGGDGSIPHDYFAVLPPVLNSPPTLSGVVGDLVQSGVDQISPSPCQAMADQLIGNCSQPTFLADFKQRFLDGLTLSGESAEDEIPLTAGLIQNSVAAIGIGNDSDASTWGPYPAASFLLTEVTRIVLPAIGLALDVNGLLDARHVSGSKHEGDHTSSKLTKAEADESKAKTALDDAKAAENKAEAAANDARDAVQQAEQNAKTGPISETDAEGLLSQEQQTVAAATRLRDEIQAEVNRAEQHGPVPANLQQRLAAVNGSIASYKGWVTRYTQLVTALQASTAAEQRLQTAKTATGKDASDLQTAKQGVAKARQALQGRLDFTDAVTEMALDFVADHGAELAQSYKVLQDGAGSPADEAIAKLLKEFVAEDGQALTKLLLTHASSWVMQNGATNLALRALPGLNLVFLGVDTASAALGLAQNATDLANTVKFDPTEHRYPPIATNVPHGTRQVPVLYVVAGNVHDLGQFLSDKWAGFAAPTTPVCDNTVLLPAQGVNGRTALIFNTSNWQDLHLSLGLTSHRQIKNLDGVPFAVLHSVTPIGAGAVSFAAPPRKGALVRVEHEGRHTTRSFTGTVTEEVTSGGGVLALRVSPTGSTHLSNSWRQVGGFVYSTTSPSDGELVGLAAVEVGGQLTVLTRAGVADLVGSCGSSEGP